MSRLTTLIDRMFDYNGQSCIEDGVAAYSYADTLAACMHTDARFESLNVQPGCVIGLQADYSITSAAILLAALLRACVVALIPKDRDVAACIEDACVEEFFSVDAAGHVERQRVGPAKDHPLLDELRLAGEGGIILFTASDTGRPKPVLQSTEDLLAKFAEPGQPCRTLGYLMFDHSGGLDTLLHTFSSGGTLIVTRDRDPESISALIESHKVELLPVADSADPTVELMNKRFPQIRIARSGPAPSSDAHELRNGL